MYDRYGRAKASQVAARFYDAVLRSPALFEYFEDVSIPALVDHQALFLAAVMGGPSAQNRTQLRDMHAHLDIRPEDFDEMIRLLRESLESVGIAPEDVDAVCGRYRGFRNVIATGHPL